MNFGGDVDLDFGNDADAPMEESEGNGSVLVPGIIIARCMRLSFQCLYFL